MKSQDEQVAMQGIEFWSNVCDEEIQLADELEQAEIDGARTPLRYSRHYAKGALQYLVPILTEKMTQQVPVQGRGVARIDHFSGKNIENFQKFILRSFLVNSITGF